MNTIYRTQTLPDDEDTHGLLLGAEVIMLDPPKKDHDKLILKVNQLCERLCLDAPKLPQNTEHVMVIWMESETTVECYGHLIAFDGDKNHYFNLQNFNDGPLF